MKFIITYKSGRKKYISNGKYHREDGPARTAKNQYAEHYSSVSGIPEDSLELDVKWWYTNGVITKVQWESGMILLYNDKFQHHCETGPSHINSTSYNKIRGDDKFPDTWCLNDEKITIEQVFELAVKNNLKDVRKDIIWGRFKGEVKK